MITGPYPVKYAREWIVKVHRRIPQLTGAMWCIGLWEGVEMRGLAVVGRGARMLDVPAGDRIETLIVSRVAVVDGTPNGCSMLYGACSRAARAMGTSGLATYIHEDEPGTTLIAAGWIRDEKPTSGGEHSREKRPRKKALDAKPKIRWWAPWSEQAQTKLAKGG